MLRRAQLAVVLSTLQSGLGRLRHQGASLWALPLQILTIALLVALRRVGPEDNSASSYEVHFAASVALGIYLAAITLGHFGIGAWSAAHSRYGALRSLALQVVAVLLFVFAVVPLYVVVIDSQIMDYYACHTQRCHILAPLVAGIGCSILALGAVIPTSALWFFLARPVARKPATQGTSQQGTALEREADEFRPLRLHYELKFRDYYLFNALHQFFLVISQVMYVGLGVFVGFGELEQRGALGAIYVGILAYVGGWLAQLVINVYVLWSEHNRTLLTEHMVETRLDGLYEENPFSRSFHKWSGITRVASRPGFVAVYINAHAAHLIPTRAFSSKGQRDDFVRQLRSNISAD